VPEDNILGELNIDPERPICYVLKSNTIFDFLVLDIFCEKKGLPRPLASVDDLREGKGAASIYLSHVGVLRTYGAYRNEPPSPFFKLLRRAQIEDAFDVQMVPVSIFWGRAANRSEPSVFKLFFPDDDRAGFIQKLLIVLAQGKSVAVNFAKPILLREQISTSMGVEQTARKLTRVVRVHFQTLRAAVLGPGLISRNRIIETLIRGKALRSSIDDECRKKNIPRVKAERLAKEYISEIAAEVSPEVISGASVLLKRLWNRIYNGVQVQRIDRVRSLPANAEVVYVPCHRSHMDYLLINYVLYDQHILTPHVAAGINLNFWPVGSFLRRLGAFYIRRTFNNNRLYSVSFSEYVAFLLQKGFPLQFFLEGGRSRTGKLLQPKTGMVAMVVSSFLRNHDRPIYFVPVYFYYDRVVEVRTYRKELAGTKKKAESVGQLAKGVKSLWSSYGDVFISFAEPLELGAFLERMQPGWSEQTYDVDSKPSWLTPVVQSLAQNIMVRINESAVAGSVALVSLILLATRQRALPEEELINHIDTFRNLLKIMPYSADAQMPDAPAKTIIQHAVDYGKLVRFSGPGGDVIHAVEPQASYIMYYRNNIAHLFAMPSVVAYFLQHNDSINESVVINGVKMFYPILKKEFFLRWDQADIEQVVRGYINAMVDLKLLSRVNDTYLRRPEMTSPEFNILRTLGLVLGASLERFALAAQLLCQYGTESFGVEDFQNQCVMMAQRVSLLTGSSDLELPSGQVFGAILEQLGEHGMIERVNDKSWKLTDKFSESYEVSSALLSLDIRQNLSRVKGL
jgi:glycerol-3-phosphate O-acyltransferase